MLVRYLYSLADVVTPPRPFDVGLGPGLLQSLDNARFRLLNTVDPYGDTVFNYIQVDDLLKEWRLIETSLLSDEERSTHAAAIALAERAREERCFVAFIGD